MWAIGGNTPNSTQPRIQQEIDSPIHGSCRCVSQHGVPVYLPVSVSHPAAYGIMNWFFINKRRTPGSSHALHFSDELLQINFMWFLLCVMYTECSSLLNPQYTFSAKYMVWFFFFYISQSIYGHIVWAWKRVIAYSHTWWVLRSWRMLDWMKRKKDCHSPFNCSLMRSVFFTSLKSHLSALMAHF